MSSPRALSCPSCGAPAAQAAGDAVVCCAYCGTAMLTEGAGPGPRRTVEAHYVLDPVLRREDLPLHLGRAMGKRLLAPRRLSSDYVLETVEARLVPYWVVRTRSETLWTGSDVRIAAEDAGPAPREAPDWTFDEDVDPTRGSPLKPAANPPRHRVRARKDYVPRDGRFEESHEWPVYARRGDAFWGLDALHPGGLRMRPDWGTSHLAFLGRSASRIPDLLLGRRPFTVDVLPEGMALLAAHVDPREAERQAREEIESAAWRRAKARVAVLHECRTHSRIEETALVHLPLWWASYRWRGRGYRALVAGDTGRILALEYPVSPWAHVLVGGGFALLASALAAVLEGTDLPLGLRRAIWIFALCLWTATLLRALRLATDRSDEPGGHGKGTSSP